MSSILLRVKPSISATRSFSTSVLRLDAGLKFKPNTKTQVEVGSMKQPGNNKRVDPRLMKRFARDSIYDPFDFSLARIHLDRKESSSNRSANDMFDKFGVNPLDLYTSPEILSQFLSSTGKILHRDVTGLSAKNQRRLSKAIRRAQAIGLLSKTHKDVSFLPTRTSGRL